MQIPLSLDGPSMRVRVLGSGSSGNSLVVESGARRLLIDAGFSCRELEKRLKLGGLTPEALDAVILTHEHSDHSRGASVLARRYGLDLYATQGTLEKLGTALKGAVAHTIGSGSIYELDGFQVEPFAIPHDAAEPVGLVIEDEAGNRMGLAADLGTCSRLAWARLVDLDFLVLETNHDLEMLRSGPYPWHLKQRIAGRHGHLSNREAAQGIPELLSDRLRWVVPYHLSRTNNDPALAIESIAQELSRYGSNAEICVTHQTQSTPWLALEADSGAAASRRSDAASTPLRKIDRPPPSIGTVPE